MQYIVEEAVSAGIEDILIITNRGKDVMEDYFDYAPELEDKLRRAGKDDLIELVHKPANLANIFFVRQKQTLGPVSYTHLDVYKRQGPADLVSCPVKNGGDVFVVGRCAAAAQAVI